MATFLIDAQLPPALVEVFRAAGHEAEHVLDAGLLAAPDGEISAYCAGRDMIMVTKDQDFGMMRRLSKTAPRVLWIRLGNTTNRALRARLRPILREITVAFEAGEEIIEVR